MSHFRSPSSSGDSDASGEYEGMAGNDQASPGRAYAQRAWDEDALTFVDMNTPGRLSSHQTSPTGEGVSLGRPSSQQGEYSSNESGEDDYGRGEDEGDEDEEDEDEPLYSQQVEGMPEHTLPSNPPYAPQSVPSAPRIKVSEHGPPSNRPGVPSRSPEALADDMGQEDDPNWYRSHGAEFSDLPPGMYFGSTPFEHPSQDPSPSGGYAGRDSSVAPPNVSEQDNSPFTQEMMAMGWPRDAIPRRQEHGGTPLPLRPAGGSSSERSAERTSSRSQPNVSPHPLSSAQGSMAAQGSPFPSGNESDDDDSQDGGGGVAVEPSPSVQELTTPPSVFRRRPRSSAQHAGQYLDPQQQRTGHQKRVREGSSSSNGSHLHPPRKQRGERGPSVSQRVTLGQNIDTALHSISGLEARSQAPAQGAGRPYGDPNPQGRAGASEREQIRQAYARQVLPESRPDPFAGMRRGAPSAYARGPSLGYGLPPPQGESSALGSSHSRPYPAQPGVPYAPQHQAMQGAGQLPREQHRDPDDPVINIFGPRFEVPQPQPEPEPESGSELDVSPMRGMDAGAVWRFISGEGEDGYASGIMWDGHRYRNVDNEKRTRWRDDHLAQLRVILASYQTWAEVDENGQDLPGQRSIETSANKAWALRNPGVWTEEQDSEVDRLSSEHLEERQAALNRLQREFGRSRDEIVGRCMLFARSSERQNLGNRPLLGSNRFRKGGRV